MAIELKHIDKPTMDVETGDKLYECPHCGGTIAVPQEVFYGRCDTCQLTFFDYEPLPHQVAFHESDARVRASIGGYGAGKTTQSIADLMLNHVYQVPNGRTLVTAQTLQQVREAILPEIDRFAPPWLLDRPPSKSNNISYRFTNGHRLFAFASNDAEKLKSLNLTAFFVEEASGVDLDIFTQLMTRLRNNVGIKKDVDGNIIEDRLMGILSSNPEQGWLFDDFVLHSREVVGSDSVDVESYRALAKKPNKSYATFITSTRDNINLRPGFIDDISIGKSPQWIAKYIDASMELREGAIYKDFVNNVVDDFEIPSDWKRVYGFDKGFRDPTSVIELAVNPYTGVLFAINEYYVAERPVQYHAEKLKDFIHYDKKLIPIQADPTVYNKSDHDGKSYADLFRRYSGGMYLHPAVNSIDAGIERVRDYMFAGKLKFFRSLEHTRDEIINYVYKETSTGSEKPSETNNHLMDALRYAIMGLPADPDKVRNVIVEDIDYSQKYDPLGMYEDIKEESNNKSLVTIGNRVALIGGNW